MVIDRNFMAIVRIWLSEITMERMSPENVTILERSDRKRFY